MIVYEMTAIYIAHCHYIDTQGTTQENITKEAEELAKKKLGPDVGITYQVKY